MPVFQLNDDTLMFPSALLANDEGLLAIGGKLQEDWLLTAYSHGLFPWYNEGEPILWWSPDPRCVLLPSEVKVQKSMKPLLNNSDFEFKLDSEFEQVIDICSKIPRNDQHGTWITKEMKNAYIRLHEVGMAHSAEIWRKGKLVGGLYGVSIGGVFFGESMFSHEPNMSKLALIRLCKWLENRDFLMIDCQVPSPHLARMGAIEVDRIHFLEALNQGLMQPTRKGKWEV